MKEEWKAYIKGVPYRGDEVIKILVDLGGRNEANLCNAENDYYVYYINHKGDIDCENIDSEIAQIIMDNYTELHLPENWKDGDILINLEGDTFVVFCNDVPDFSFRACLQVNESVCQEYSSGLFCYRNNYRLATPAEVDKFQDILRKKGKHWNMETKKLEDAEVRLTDAEQREQLPDYDTLYFYIESNGEVHAAVFQDFLIDNERFGIGNFFHTREEANGMAEKVKNLLKGGHE